MKKLFFYQIFGFLCMMLITSLPVYAQKKHVIAVVSINSVKMPYSSEQLTDAARNSMEKLNLYQVVDKYDQIFLAEQKQFNLNDCLSKTCLYEAGTVLEATHILTGSVESFGMKVIVKLRLFDMSTQEVEKFKIIEYLDLKDQVQTMIDLSVRSLLDLPVDQDVFRKLTEEFAFESSINTPEVQRLDLNGPRMGITILTGTSAKIFSDPKSKGGYDAIPVLSQFGYQFEINYLNEGNFQALFEIVPVIVGLDQSLFIPVLNILNGLRNSKNGLEFGFGPQLTVVKKAKGYYVDDVFIIADPQNTPEGYTNESRLHSNGNYVLATNFIFAVGKTFKSGSLNLPVNIFYKPAKNAHQFGVSVGYNVSAMKKRRK